MSYMTSKQAPCECQKLHLYVPLGNRQEPCQRQFQHGMLDSYYTVSNVGSQRKNSDSHHMLATGNVQPRNKHR